MITRLARLCVLSLAALAFAAGAPAGANDAAAQDAGRAKAGGHDAHEHIGLAGGANTDPAEIRRDLAIYTFVVFLILLAILWKFAWGPIASSLEAREKHIHNEIAAAEQANAEAKRLLAEHDKKLTEVQNEVRVILDEARRDAQHTQTEILKQAQAEAQAARDRAKREIEQARDLALKQLFDQAADLATEVAGRIVQRSLNPQDHRDLVQQALNELPSKN
ncbi:MAG: F0F1 ATP synthase subunit B [Planctomycetes bacterium]|nr:F0F1 ATP synthase subunit B [Planctomycetota bacterium]